MKTDEITPLESLLTGDFRSIEPHMIALDKHLTLRKKYHCCSVFFGACLT